MADMLKQLGKRKIVIEVSSDELDRFIQIEYDQPSYESIPMEEWSNYSNYSFDVDGKVDSYGERELAKFIETGRGFMITRVLLNDLARKGIIETGEYLISVSW